MAIQAVYTADQVNKIGMVCLKLIRNRTLKGFDVNDAPFKEYSKNAFKIPYSQSKKTIIKELVKSGNAEIRTDKAGKKMVIVEKGYLPYKIAVYAGTGYDGTVNLTLTGSMMRDLNLISANENTFTIGFTQDEMARRAYYNQSRGRVFIGLSPSDLTDPELLSLLKDGITIKNV